MVAMKVANGQGLVVSHVPKSHLSGDGPRALGILQDTADGQRGAKLADPDRPSLGEPPNWWLLPNTVILWGSGKHFGKPFDVRKSRHHPVFQPEQPEKLVRLQVSVYPRTRREPADEGQACPHARHDHRPQRRLHAQR